MALKYRKWAGFIILMVLLGLSAIPAQAAGSGIRITTETGFNGKVKTGAAFPVKVTVENNGKDFKGDLLINFYPTYNMSGSKAIHIDVPKGSSKTYSLSLLGNEEGQYNNGPGSQTIFLYEGSWKDGKETSFLGNKKLSVRLTDPTRKTLGLLSGDPDRLKELKAFPPPANETDVVVLEESSLPEDSNGLDSLDYIVLDDFPFSNLKSAQQEAILSWIKNGGILIAGGAADAAQAYGNLYRELPMEPSKEGKANLTSLAAAVKPGTDFASVPAFFGKPESNAEIVLKSGDIPVLVKKNYGAGEIWQTAFSAGANPVASWKGYSEWFATSILDKAHSSKTGGSQGQMPFEQFYYEFAESNEYFPSLYFSAGQITLMLLIYILLAGPALYFLLKRWDKREHAWWIVPAFALVCSVVIFALGAKDRIGRPQVSQMGVYKAEAGQLQGLEAVSLLSNTSGKYELEFPKGEFDGVPGSQMQTSAPQRFAVLEEGRKKSTVSFPNVEYWATRSIYGKAARAEKGNFKFNLSYTGKKLSGTIENHFPYDFENIYIWSGSKQIELGSLKKGAALTLDKEIGQSYLSGPISQGPAYLQPGTLQDMDKMKKMRLEYVAVEYLYNHSQVQNLPIIYGVTKQPVTKVELLNRPEENRSISLIYQAAEVQTNFSGPFTINQDALSGDVRPIKGGIIDKPPGRNEIAVEDGLYDYVLKFPPQLMEGKASLSELSITWYPNNNVTFSILDPSTGEYQPLNETNVTFKDHPEKFVTKEGAITLRFEKTGQGDPMMRLPSVTIKGEAGK